MIRDGDITDFCLQRCLAGAGQWWNVHKLAEGKMVLPTKSSGCQCGQCHPYDYSLLCSAQHLVKVSIFTWSGLITLLVCSPRTGNQKVHLSNQHWVQVGKGNKGCCVVHEHKTAASFSIFGMSRSLICGIICSEVACCKCCKTRDTL